MRKKRQRTAVFLRLVMAGLLLLSACSASQPASAGEGSAPQGQEYDVAFPSDISGTIDFYQPSTHWVDGFDELIGEFSRWYPNITVTQRVDASTDFVMRADTMGDIWLNSGPDSVWQRLQREGLLLDLSGQPFLEESDYTDLYRCGDTVTGMPYILETVGISYHTELLEKEDLLLPVNETQLWAWGDTLVQRGYHPFAVSRWYAANISIAAASCFLTQEEADACALTAERLADRETAKPLLELIAGVYQNLQKYGPCQPEENVRQVYEEGDAASYIGFEGEWGGSGSAGYLTPKSVAAPLPVGEQRVAVMVQGGFSVNAATESKEACLAFLNFVVKESSRFVQVSPCLSAIRDTEIAEEVSPAAQAVLAGKCIVWKSREVCDETWCRAMEDLWDRVQAGEESAQAAESVLDAYRAS